MPNQRSSLCRGRPRPVLARARARAWKRRDTHCLLPSALLPGSGRVHAFARDHCSGRNPAQVATPRDGQVQAARISSMAELDYSRNNLRKDLLIQARRLLAPSLPLSLFLLLFDLFVTFSARDLHESNLLPLVGVTLRCVGLASIFP